MKKLWSLFGFHTSFWVMVLKLSKIVQFLQICSELSKEPKPVKAIYIYASESSLHPLSKLYGLKGSEAPLMRY